MKKVLLVAVAGMFVLSSCKKVYTCECKWTSGSLSGQVVTLTSQEKMSKKDATTWCDGNSVSGITCELNK